jgi:hypothetical protein
MSFSIKLDSEKQLKIAAGLQTPLAGRSPQWHAAMPDLVTVNSNQGKFGD